MSFTSWGFVFIKILVIMPLIHTDLPEPVEPAINICGILVISQRRTLPEISLPNGTSKGFGDWIADWMTSLKDTKLVWLFGTSIPTYGFPGIGASIRISLAARARAISSLKFTILLTFTPIAGWISYFVTAGPSIGFGMTLASTPKLANVRSKIRIFRSTIVRSFDWSDCWTGFSKVTGGNW